MPSPNPTPFAALQAWADSAPSWELHRATIRAMFGPISRAMIQQASIAPGNTVLDVAGGTGEPALAIAEACGPSGWVVCTDAIFAMTATARREADRLALAHLRVTQCISEALPFRSDSFDAAVCRLGVMFFADPLHALREMLRVLKPGGRICLAVWHRSESNPFLALPSSILAKYVPLPPVGPDDPGAFRFAAPGKLAGLFHQAGVHRVDEQVHSFRIEAALSPDEYWPLRSDLSETLRAKKALLSPPQLASLEAEVREAARPFFSSGRMSFPAEAILVSGEKA